eukprot:scaffold20302_cov185-Amphora_coffeaeformis.AAC.5
MFYKAVVQSVLLYGCETWVVTTQVLATLESFHHRVARRLTGKVIRWNPSEKRWVYPPLDEALEDSGLLSIAHYIRVRQRTLEDTSSTFSILRLCENANGNLARRDDKGGGIATRQWMPHRMMKKYMIAK